jgi:hypothetical protein
MPSRAMTLLLALWMGAPSAPAGEAASTAPWRLSRLAPRSPDALTGSQFARRVRDLSAPDRQRAILAELERGNLPDFLRTVVPLALQVPGPNGSALDATVFVLPDYLAIGSNADFVYVPLAYVPAATIARELGFVLPTPKLVDAIYAQSRHHLAPEPLPACPEMRSIPYLMEHQRIIDAQRRGLPLGELISGHKKDLVLSERLIEQPGRVAIYGWHRGIGDPIQPLSTVHGEGYADYSHGVRLVGETVLIGGQEHSIYEVLDDPALAPALNYEGVLPDARRLMGLGPLVARHTVSVGP